MKKCAIIIALLMFFSSAFSQEVKKTVRDYDKSPIRLEQPRLPYNTSIQPSTLPTSKTDSPSFLNDSLLRRGSSDPLLMAPQAEPSIGSNGTSVMKVGTFDVVGASTMDSHPGMMDTRSAALGLTGDMGNLSMSFRVEANRYGFNMLANPVLTSQGIVPVRTQLDISGSLSYRFDDHWSITAFGRYYDRNPYFSMGAFPYVATSAYGGYATYRNGWFGMDLGAERRYDAFARRWINEPIVTPKFKLAKKIWLELPVGPLVRDGLDHVIHHRQNGPTIMPQMR